MKKFLLPLVMPEIAQGVAKDMESGTWTEDYSEHIDKINPTISHYLAALVEETPEGAKEFALLAGLLIYRMLEAQAECNEMERTINLG